MNCPVTGLRCESTGCSIYINGKCGKQPTVPLTPPASGTPSWRKNLERIREELAPGFQSVLDIAISKIDGVIQAERRRCEALDRQRQADTQAFELLKHQVEQAESRAADLRTEMQAIADAVGRAGDWHDLAGDVRALESRAASATALLRECRNALTTGYVNCRGDKCRQLNCTACFGDDAESYDALIARIDAASGEAG